MDCCKSVKNYPAPHVSKYPCKINVSKPCLNIGLQALVDLHEKKEEEEKRKEKEEREKKNQKVEKKPCGNVKPPSKKKFLELGEKKICAMCFPRKWNAEDTNDSELNEFSNWFIQKGKAQKKWLKKCPRELDPYEKNLWIPFCEPRKKPKECKEPIDKNVCVFCLENLYTGGYIHELFEKTPLIKKQSEISGDEIAWRVGIRTRIIVHKKCYDSYVESFTKDKEKEPDIDLDSKVEEDDDDLNCGEEEEEEYEEYEPEEDEEEEEQAKSSKKKPKDDEEWKCHKNQHFCLKKCEFPVVDSAQNEKTTQQTETTGNICILKRRD